VNKIHIRREGAEEGLLLVFHTLAEYEAAGGRYRAGGEDVTGETFVTACDAYITDEKGIVIDTCSLLDSAHHGVSLPREGEDVWYDNSATHYELLRTWPTLRP
jgi:hypothetical protein